MKRLALLLALMLPLPSSGQMMMGLDKTAAAPYNGPGDVQSGALVYWGLRAYNQTYATGLNKLANVCTPADASCADVNSDASGNFNLAGSGLTCNNSGSICTIKTFYDQIGTACSGACNATQATIANRPILVISCVGGKVCATSTSSNQGYATTATLSATQAQPFTIVVTAERTAGFTTNGILYSDAVNTSLFASTSANQWAEFAGSSVNFCTATCSTNDSVWHAGQIQFNNPGTNTVFVDGLSQAPGGPAGNSINNGTLGLLAQASATPWQGNFAELGIWNSIAFNSTQAGNMNTNQHNYWGF